MMETTFHLLLYRAFHMQRSYLRPCLREIGLGSGQPKLLSYIAAHPHCRPKELADYFEIDPAAVSRMLDTMEKSGFIVRRADDRNRRSACLSLTEAGAEAFHGWRAHCQREDAVMLRGFTEKEKAQFADFLVRAYRNLQDAQREETACGK